MRNAIALCAFIIGLLICFCREAHCAPPAPPAIRAVSAILIDAQTGRTLYAKDPDRRLPPASTTKIMTGLLLARDVPPERIFVASPSAAITPGNALGMRPGERFSARDMLHAILLISANDASAVAAEQMAGSTTAFAGRMNAEARRLNAGNTHFSNPHGLPSPDHYSTAHDLAAIAREAMRVPAFAATVRTRTYPLSRDGGRPATLLTNKNELLGRVPGMDGIKTGWTTEAGYCFVGSATRGGRRLIAVVLHSPDWQGETAALLEYGFRIASAQPQNSASLPQRNKRTADVIAPHGATGAERAADADGVSGKHHPDGGFLAAADAARKKLLGPSTDGGAPGPASGPTAPASPADRHSTGGNIGTASNPNRGDRPVAPTPEHSTPGLDHSHAIQPDQKAAPSHRAAGSNRFGATIPALQRGDWWWLLWLILLCLALWLLWWAARSRRLIMNLLRLAAPFRRRREPRRRGDTHASETVVTNRKAGGTPVKPLFTFDAKPLERREGLEWLDSILETPNRLLEPAVRRQTRGLVDADPIKCSEKILPLLTATGHKLRLVAAELLAHHLPNRAEKTLLALLKDEQTPPEVRGEAVQQLAAMGGDRHEALWLQMLLRDGSPPAAHALAMLPRLEDGSSQALRHVLRQPAEEARDRDEELKRKLRAVQIACVLCAHEAIEAEEAHTHLQAVPANHRDQAVVSALRGISRPWPVERLVQTALHGHAYPALQALMECDPMLVEQTVAGHWEHLDTTARTRATILKWLILGEGDLETLQKLAAAGNDLASGAIKLGRTQRWDPNQASPDALLAAAQVVSLRLGYSRHGQDQIAHAFRRAAAGDGADALSAAGELEPLAQAYANAEVYDAVQTAMHTEDGMSALLACLARRAEDQRYQEELAFWGDKMPSETRLFLTQALCSSDSPAAKAALAARANDSNPTIRAAALRSLHARAAANPVSDANPIPDSELEKEPAAVPIDQAA